MSDAIGEAGMNVCAIRRKSDGYFYELTHEHGSGWTERIRSAWTLRQARLIMALVNCRDAARAALRGTDK